MLFKKAGAAAANQKALSPKDSLAMCVVIACVLWSNGHGCVEAQAAGCSTSGVNTKPDTGQSRLTACPSFTFCNNSSPKRSSKPAVTYMWWSSPYTDYLVSEHRKGLDREQH